MRVTRRNFIKGSVLAGAGLAVADLGINISEAKAASGNFKLTGSKEYTSVCTFCACGCGTIGYVKNGKLINLEGDPDHIVSEGGLCSKGASLSVIPNSDQRVTVPMYRAPGSSEWKEISWNEAIEGVAKSIKETRDRTWIKDEVINNTTYRVNRTDRMGMIGSAQINNEECYLYAKLARLMGVVFLEHQARLCHSSTVPALGSTFGRGAMTNSWQDIQNAKVILIEGSNAAENHPMSMKWVMRAKENGAKVISVDPRFTRTSKIADIFAQIRPGTDIAFLSSIINYILVNDLYNKDYIETHTNAYLLIHPDFSFNDGVFSGYNDTTRNYNMDTWEYQLDAAGKPKKANSLSDPDCVFQKLREHFSRYDFGTASSITGIPADKIKQIADVYIENSPGTIMYALGMTQHTVGVQNIRCFAVLQLLLGNMGVAGGGINALRGEPNVQGSTDFALLFNYLPGYLTSPVHTDQSIYNWESKYGTFRSQFLVSLMKSWFGTNATAQNDYCFDLIPKRDGRSNYSIYRIFEQATQDEMDFLFIAGQNPMVTNPNLNVVYEGLKKVKTLVVAELFMTETAAFWERPGGDPSKINTEVYFLPAASFLEKDGCLANSSRMIQWRYDGLKPVGRSKSDLEIADLIFNKVKELYKDSTDSKDQVFKLANWNYPVENMSESVLKEISGYNLQSGKLLNGIGEIRGDGSTSCGNWVYAGVFNESEGNKTKKRDFITDPSGQGLYPNYCWVWPGNIRILYNRASCDKNGVPYNPDKKLIWWDETAGKWAGNDVPDVPAITAHPNTPNGQRPFRMSGEGLGRLFAAKYIDYNPEGGRPRDASQLANDGPLPEFYEPVESPTENILHPTVNYNPCLIYPRLKDLQPIGTSDKFPYVLCTSSITEHWCGGGLTRNIPWLNELMKETYMEVPMHLAKELNIANGDPIIVNSARGEVEAKAMLTNRISELQINGKPTTIVWMPYNWGFKGLSQAASTNLLTIDAGDPNTWIQETKACLVNVRKA